MSGTDRAYGAAENRNVCEAPTLGHEQQHKVEGWEVPVVGLRWRCTVRGGDVEHGALVLPCPALIERMVGQRVLVGGFARLLHLDSPQPVRHGARNPRSKVEDRGSGVEGPGSMGPGPTVQGVGSKVWGPGSRFEGLGSWVLGLGSMGFGFPGIDGADLLVPGCHGPSFSPTAHARAILPRFYILSPYALSMRSFVLTARMVLPDLYRNEFHGNRELAVVIGSCSRLTYLDLGLSGISSADLDLRKCVGLTFLCLVSPTATQH
eukprot:1523798-Rhodomonas_salina.3